jgi:Flp pilus assembly protein TadD
LFRAAAQRFPRVAALHSGYGCCAGHQGLHDDAILAAKRALELEPDRSEFVSDLGWILRETGRLDEAEETLARAVGMDPGNELAAENLRICRERATRAKIVE